ncbi:MAG: peptidylprolyl isomerase [Tissierellia bacterium]|nr:peptidylprolyl isomerase [Tissierellia bacterium]
MKKTKLLATGLALTLALSACSAPATGMRTSDKPYFSINDEKISKENFYQQYDLYAQVQAYNSQLTGQVLNIFERDYVIKKDLEENKVEVKEEEYKKAIDEAITNIGGEEAFQEYLDLMDTNRETFEANIKANVDSNAHAKWYSENHPVDDEKLKEIYEKSKNNVDWIDTSHIIVETEEEAQKVYDELQAGADFKELSDKHSTDEAAKASGGSIGKLTVSDLDPLYVQGALKLEKGEYSKPVKSSFGYHIILLNDKGVGVEANLDQLTKMANATAIEEYITEKIKALDIKFFDRDGKEIVNEKPEPEGDKTDSK